MKSRQHVLLRGGTIGAALRAATGGSPAKFFKQADTQPAAARLVLVTGDNRRVSI